MPGGFVEVVSSNLARVINIFSIFTGGIDLSYLSISIFILNLYLKFGFAGCAMFLIQIGIGTITFSNFSHAILIRAGTIQLSSDKIRKIRVMRYDAFPDISMLL